ncbi:MAG: hypothetical protein P9M03_09300 [Candidatus Theseobacter exili]|nr:hypothetical protein [Candidatus Theseobacter exili]
MSEKSEFISELTERLNATTVSGNVCCVHKERIAEGFCVSCGKGLCRSCRQLWSEGDVCKKCLPLHSVFVKRLITFSKQAFKLIFPASQILLFISVLTAFLLLVSGSTRAIANYKNTCSLVGNIKQVRDLKKAGTLLIKAGRTEDGEKCFYKAVSISFDSLSMANASQKPIVQFVLAGSLSEQGRNAEAITWYKKNVVDYPDLLESALAAMETGKILEYHMDNPSEALKYYEKAEMIAKKVFRKRAKDPLKVLVDIASTPRKEVAEDLSLRAIAEIVKPPTEVVKDAMIARNRVQKKLGIAIPSKGLWKAYSSKTKSNHNEIPDLVIQRVPWKEEKDASAFSSGN